MFLARASAIVTLLVAGACSTNAAVPDRGGPKGDEGQGPSGSFGGDGEDDATAPTSCAPPGQAAGDSATIAPEFAPAYHAFDLGTIPGIPAPLGGCVIETGDANTLLVAGRSEQSDGAIYSVKVKRDACKHIVGFEGTATKLIDAPFVDASLVFGPNGTLIFPMWNADEDPHAWPGKLAQKTATSRTHTVIANVKQLGNTRDQGPGGLGFVPPGLAAEGELRAISQPEGDVLHVGYETTSDGIRVTSVEARPTHLEGWPGGFAYVPAGSPGFAKPSMMVAEWNANVVSTYEVDEQGDPIVSTRKLFFDEFTRPWGAYFDAITGDYLFLTWGGKEDRVFVVQGFAVPPPGPR